jgi:hypothetical protein
MKNETETIKRSEALREMDIREDTFGHRRSYSITFVTKSGELKSFSNATSCGLRMDMKSNRMRGVQQLDLSGNKIGTPIAVSIDAMVSYNNRIIVL